MGFTKIVLGVLLALLLFFSLAEILALEEFVDDEGALVKAPDPQKVYNVESPGSLAKEAAFHDPVISTRKLIQGLETTRIIKITVPHPLIKVKNSSPKTPIKAIYLVDKDKLVLGYQSFSARQSEVVYETKMNSAVNYLEIYVECRKHGIWLKKTRLD